MNDVKLYIGPMSINVVDACIEFANDTETVLGLIPSRRQVDYKGGYVNNWTTKQFSEYVDNKVVYKVTGKKKPKIKIKKKTPKIKPKKKTPKKKTTKKRGKKSESTAAAKYAIYGGGTAAGAGVGALALGSGSGRAPQRLTKPSYK